MERRYGYRRQAYLSASPYRLVTALLSALLFLTGCATATTSARPAWVDGQASSYAPHLYLTAVGIGDSRASAENRARAELAKTFEVRVTDSFFLSASEKAATGKASELQQEVSQTLQATTDKVLAGVEVKKHWVDKETKLHYAVAVLDRERAVNDIFERLQAFDKRLSTGQKLFLAERGKLARIRLALEMVELSQARQALNSDLRIVKPTGAGFQPSVSMADALQLVRQAYADLRISVAIEGRHAETIQTSITEGLGKIGFPVAASTGNADLEITGNLRSEPLPGQNGSPWVWSRAKLRLRIHNRATGKDIDALEITDRQASQTYDEAVHRANREVAAKASVLVAKRIEESFRSPPLP